MKCGVSRGDSLKESAELEGRDWSSIFQSKEAIGVPPDPIRVVTGLARKTCLWPMACLLSEAVLGRFRAVEKA